MPVSFRVWCRRILLQAGLAVIVPWTGCAERCEPEIGPLPPAPVGSNTRAIQQRQIDAALADRFTVYRHEWADAGNELGHYGSQHLEEIAARAAETDHPILIEWDADAELNESRRERLVRYLTERHVGDAEHRVVVGRPAVPGTPGDEAIEIFDSRPLPSSSRGGAGASSGGSSGHASSPGGF